MSDVGVEQKTLQGAAQEVRTEWKGATEEQLVYAGILDKGMKLGLAILVVTFLVYVFGILEPFIPVEDLPKYWGLPVGEYLQQTGIPTGWGWVGLLGNGDFLNFIGIAVLAGVTIVCYLPIMPVFRRNRDTIYATIAIVEVAVLVLAASGILHVGGH